MSCQQTRSSTSEVKDDVVIAQVGDRILYKSRIADLFNNSISSEEQDILVKGFVSNWIREQLLIEEAEKNIPTDVNIEMLVEDYRSSLILNYYENKLVSELLDTFVSMDQKQAYYDKSKNEFVLTESIFKGIVFQIPKSKATSKLKKAVKEEDLPLIFSLTEGDVIGKVVTHEKWFSTQSILNTLPSKKINESTLKKKGDHSFIDKNYQYFVKTKDYVSKNEVPPLEYIESKITQIILNNRKKALLNRKKQQLYDQNYNNNKIIINLD